MKKLAVLALLLAPAIAAAQTNGPTLPVTPRPSASQGSTPDAPINGVTYLYGEQKCPVDANGNEVTVCVRLNASEQFRIPKNLREGSIKPEYEAWAARSRDVVDQGQVGIGSCSAVGAGGIIGCANQQFVRARKENKERAAEQSREEAAITPN
ncbi:MAG: hypothetical protein A4S16_13325 [Proteobacteria bacterium SG_bin6]|nr:MAG: hypothetical protein A4S16_13325 [Proteobacteria bacterium SG_bin6]